MMSVLVSRSAIKPNDSSNAQQRNDGRLWNLLIRPPTVLRNGATARKKFVKVSLKRWSICKHVQRDAMRRIVEGHKNIRIWRKRTVGVGPVGIIALVCDALGTGNGN